MSHGRFANISSELLLKNQLTACIYAPSSITNPETTANNGNVVQKTVTKDEGLHRKSSLLLTRINLLTHTLLISTEKPSEHYELQ